MQACNENIHGHSTRKPSRKLVSMVTTWPGCLRYAFLKEVITCFWFRLGKPCFNDVLKFNQGLPQVVKILVTMAPKMYLFILPFFHVLLILSVILMFYRFLDRSATIPSGKLKLIFLSAVLSLLLTKR